MAKLHNAYPTSNINTFKTRSNTHNDMGISQAKVECPPAQELFTDPWKGMKSGSCVGDCA